MWRLLLLVAAMGALGLACSDELSVPEEFVKLMQKTREGTFTVTYDREGPQGPREPITWYRMGEYQRTDIDVAERTRPVVEGYRLTVLRGPEGSYVCSDVATGTTYGLAGCVRESGAVPFLNGPPSYLGIAISRAQVLRVERLEGRTVAGLDSRCFEVEADSGDGPDMDLCLTADGVPLYIEVPIPNIDSQVVYTATSLSGEVPDGIFEPPMEIVGENPICAQLAC